MQKITPGITKIGWIGTGVMGLSMASHLIKSGYDLKVYNRSQHKAESLKSIGATVTHSPGEAALDADVVFTMVGMPSDVREVILDEEKGALKVMKQGSILVDMTTSDPELSEEIYNKAKDKGISSIDAPVSGGDIGAREARLSIMAGGDEESFVKVTPLFELMGKNINYFGSAGSGQRTKIVNQILIANTMIGVCEGLLLANKAGLDPLKVIAAVGSGAAGSFSVNVLGPRIVNNDFNPGFYVDHFVKDLEIALKESKKMNLKLNGLELAHSLYKELQNQGHGQKGTQALILALEKLNNITRNT